jgi:hypothetical protein
MKIGFIIPSTSKNRDNWKSIKDSYLYRLSINSFISVMDKEHTYVYYIGYDSDDRIYADKEQHEDIYKVTTIFPNISFQFVDLDGIEKGYHTKMWNKLFKKAYDDNCDYFYQCGDDIRFKTKHWINDSIEELQKHNDIGLTGPVNNNPRILTQAFVSRKHMEIFGYFFPEEIINWCCDDWYNLVYKPNYFYPLMEHFASNDGGPPRYTINNDASFHEQEKFHKKLVELRAYANEIAERDKKKIETYITSIETK